MHTNKQVLSIGFIACMYFLVPSPMTLADHQQSAIGGGPNFVWMQYLPLQPDALAAAGVTSSMWASLEQQVNAGSLDDELDAARLERERLSDAIADARRVVSPDSSNIDDSSVSHRVLIESVDQYQRTSRLRDAAVTDSILELFPEAVRNELRLALSRQHHGLPAKYLLLPWSDSRLAELSMCLREAALATRAGLVPSLGVAAVIAEADGQAATIEALTNISANTEHIANAILQSYLAD